MAEPTLRFFFREPTIDTNKPITDGTVKVQGFQWEFVGSIEECDAWDCAFGGLVRSKVTRDPLVSIPVFPNRKFRLSYIYVNSAAGIQSPRDLEGKRVGVMAWHNTAAIWAKGALQHEYGVDLKAIDWYSLGKVEELFDSGFRVQQLQKGDSLDTLLAGGELDAVLEPNLIPSIRHKDPRVRRLFPDFRTEERAYFQKTGLFPISHVVTFKQEYVDQHPEAPIALLEAFRQSRDVAIQRIDGYDPEILLIPWATAYLDDHRELMGEPYWPYDLEHNRLPLATMMEYAHEQGITPTKLDYEPFFLPEAAKYPGA